MIKIFFMLYFVNFDIELQNMHMKNFIKFYIYYNIIIVE